LAEIRTIVNSAAGTEAFSGKAVGTCHGIEEHFS